MKTISILPPRRKKVRKKLLKPLNILCIFTMAVLLLNACDNAVETLPLRPQSKFAVTYVGVYAKETETGIPPFIDLGSGNDGSSLAKAYTITLNTNASFAPAGLNIVALNPTFKPDAAATDATFAIQAIDPTTGADLSAATEAFNTKFGSANLIFRSEAALPLRFTGRLGQIVNKDVVPVGTKIPASNTGHLAYKITITPKPGSAYDGPKAHVFVKIAIRG